MEHENSFESPNRLGVRGIARVLLSPFYGLLYRGLFVVGTSFVRPAAISRRGTNLKVAPTASIKFPTSIKVGNNVFINHNCCVWAAPEGTITIGDDVLFGPGCCVFSSNHGMELGKAIRLQPGIDKDVVIGNDVWIGANSVVLPGSRIGDGTVIAAGAVVSGTLPEFSICGGVPAKFIKKRGVQQVSE